jgi:hypothetical protein
MFTFLLHHAAMAHRIPFQQTGAATAKRQS